MTKTTGDSPATGKKAARSPSRRRGKTKDTPGSQRLNLVTGATGFSGSYVIRELLNAGQRVVGTDRPEALSSPGVRDILRNTGIDIDHPQLELIGADLLAPSSIEPLFERPVTHVFHTASLYDYSASLEKLRRVNVDGTRNILRFVNQAKLKRFMHWSTCGIYGKPYTAADGSKVNLPFNEESSSPRNEPFGSTGPRGTRIVNEYSISKWEQEQMLWKAHREQGLPLTVIRPAPIYGPGSSYGHGGIILVVAHGLLPAIPADTRNYITSSVHVEDVARLACFLADREETLGQDYNAVDSSIISYHEFLHYIALLTGRKLRDIPLVPVTALRPVMMTAARGWTRLERWFRVPRVRILEVQSAHYISSSYWLSNAKSLETGFRFQYPDVREGLKETIGWFREMGWLTDRGKVFYVGTEGSKDSVTAR